jgi:hypothetical protein
MTATQEPVISKCKPTMADVLEENEFLKSQLEAYQQELARSRESYEKELIKSVRLGKNNNPGSTNHRKYMQGVHVLPMRRYLLSGRV